jgi:hypothetical protein
MGPSIIPPNIATLDRAEEQKETPKVGKLLNEFALLVMMQPGAGLKA